MSVKHRFEKPSVGVWIRTAEVLADRLSECVHVYKHSSYIFMAESERQHKSGLVIGLLQRIHKILDQADATFNLALAAAHMSDELLIAGLGDVFRDALKLLPGVSIDMQKLLKSSWMKGFPDKVAESLFWGNGEEDKGIGSGLPENGRLPKVLAAILEKEAMGEMRPPRDLPALGDPQRHDVDVSTRWGKQNKGYLRTAGRVD